jgi:DNA-binding LacI/PurR family transcriptional regulator
VHGIDADEELGRLQDDHAVNPPSTVMGAVPDPDAIARPASLSEVTFIRLRTLAGACAERQGPSRTGRCERRYSGPVPTSEDAHRGDAPARLRDVADRAGVDPSLVSRVLSGSLPFSIREETRERIVTAAAELDYRPNAQARALRRRRSMLIAMIVPSLSNVVYERIHAGASERAAELGYSLVVATGSADDFPDLLHGQVDGLLLAVASKRHAPVVVPRGIRLPIVLINRAEENGLASVTVDDAAGARLATQHLFDLGHRRVGHVAGPSELDTGRRRLTGFLAACREHGCEPDDDLIVEGGYSEQEGFAAMRVLLDRPDRPTAVFVANLQAAIGALAAARQLGLRVPVDVSVASLHDAPLAEYLDSPLTTVRMPLEEMGRRAIDLVLAPRDGAGSVRMESPPVLVVRDSTSLPPSARAGLDFA